MSCLQNNSELPQGRKGCPAAQLRPGQREPSPRDADMHVDLPKRSPCRFEAKRGVPGHLSEVAKRRSPHLWLSLWVGPRCGANRCEILGGGPSSGCHGDDVGDVGRA
jgi:hypothetical protein